MSKLFNVGGKQNIQKRTWFSTTERMPSPFITLVALLYFSNEIDLIPDWVRLIGLIDDVAVGLYACWTICSRIAERVRLPREGRDAAAFQVPVPQRDLNS